MPLKVLHIVSGELTDGASRGAYWLHQGLRKCGIDSKILTNSITTFGDPDVISLSQTKKQKLLTLIRAELDFLLLLFYPKKKKMLFSSGMFGVDITKTKAYKEADIINLHWINKGFINIKHLKKIEKPLVWTIRDMWPMTGGCHVAPAIDCDNYKHGCGNCKALSSKRKKDLSRYIFRRKQKYFPKDMTIVGVSNWISEELKGSEIFKTFDVRTLSNTISLQEFYPIETDTARKLMNIETEKKIILLGATNFNDYHKGVHKFLDALKHLDSSKYLICSFGKINASIIDSDFEWLGFGYLHDSVSMRLAYSLADVFVSPSLIESFGKTVAESMACGTPSVCFDNSGSKDIIEHKKDGYLAKSFDTQDMAVGIEWVCENNFYKNLADRGVENMKKKFSNRVIAEKYKALYQEKMNNNKTFKIG